jgi:hypothetical protein
MRSLGPVPGVKGSDQILSLAPGVYTGDLVIEGNRNRIYGIGIDRTVIRGRLVVRGSHNDISKMTVLGRVLIQGDFNDLKIRRSGWVEVHGHNNHR